MKDRGEAEIVSADAARQIGRAIEKWRHAQGKSQHELKQIAGVSQAQVSRILAGKFSRAVEPVLQLCNAAGIDWRIVGKFVHDQALRERLHAEVERCWDGTETGAETLVMLLRAASKLRQSHSATEDAAGA
ncbi:helix-turn-helix domain-containing protein [Pseudoxanthomonas japonensis]|nr:helix-turn-helix domain-containing protein [Pseudoxanthomonas japonensis]